jgi:hypothetical protein
MSLSTRIRAATILALLAVLLWLPLGIVLGLHLFPLLGLAAGCALAGAVAILVGSVLIRAGRRKKPLAGRLAQLWGAFLFGEGVLQLLFLIQAADVDNADYGIPWGFFATVATLALVALPALTTWRTRVHLRQAAAPRAR